MILSEKERDLLLTALWFRENESFSDDGLMEMINRLTVETEPMLYKLDFGWRGSVSVVATSSDEAKKLFIESGHPYIGENFFDDDPSDLEGTEINVGVINVEYGDM